MLWRCRLGGRKGIRPVKSWVVGCWSEVHTCIWTSWCHSLSLASVKSGLVLPFWQRLTRVVQDKGPLNGCVCVCAVTKCGISLVVNARLHCALSECMCISIYCTRQFLDCFGHVEWVVFVFFDLSRGHVFISVVQRMHLYSCFSVLLGPDLQNIFTIYHQIVLSLL